MLLAFEHSLRVCGPLYEVIPDTFTCPLSIIEIPGTFSSKLCFAEVTNAWQCKGV
jgi:hypothetical protein